MDRKLYYLLIPFILTVIITRIFAHIIKHKNTKDNNNKRGLLQNININNIHLHHIVIGICGMFIDGIALILHILDTHYINIVLFGVFSALVFDEFALVLHLKDVYWLKDGYKSIDAVFLCIISIVLLMLHISPISYISLFEDSMHNIVLIKCIAIIQSIILTFCCFYKGKFWQGTLSFFIPFFGLWGACRLANPYSNWAKTYYNKNRSIKLLQSKYRHELFEKTIGKYKNIIWRFIIRV